MSENAKNQNARAVVEAMLMSEDVLNAGAVARWIETYPQYHREIVEAAAFSTEFDLFEAETASTVSSETIQKDWLAVKSVLDEFPTAAIPLESLSNLREAAAKIGLEREQMLKSIGVSETLMRKIDRRILTEIPRAVQEKLAKTLCVSLESLQAFFNLPSVLPQKANYKSKTAPRAQPKQTFAEAVRNDPELSTDEKARLLDLIESEKLTPKSKI